MVKRRKYKLIRTSLLLFGCLLIIIALYFAARYNLLPSISFKAEHFGIETVKSTVDYNKNGTDDYTDILIGARADAQNHPEYNSRYWAEGYPPDNIGVCTDVIWRAFRNAGYNLREMIDRDIQARPQAYKNITVRDDNIDFRRVVNLRVFFEYYAQSLTLDTEDIEQWQPGDIVIFGADKHIGIVSDKRTIEGKTYIIHNGGQPNREENYLKRGTVTGHYRFDASKIDTEVLIPWTE